MMNGSHDSLQQDVQLRLMGRIFNGVNIREVGFAFAVIIYHLFLRYLQILTSGNTRRLRLDSGNLQANRFLKDFTANLMYNVTLMDAVNFNLGA